MRNILPIENGLIDVYNGYACTTGICIQHPAGIEWLVQNYVNYMVTYNESFDYVIFDYFYEDTIYNTAINFFQPENRVLFPYSCYSVPMDEISDIIRFIKRAIDSGYYICLFVNFKNLSQYSWETDFIHDIFIYGYDDEKELIYATGYKIGEKYRKMKHTFEEISLAYENTKIDFHTADEFDTKRISFFKYKENFRYNFRIDKFIRSLKEYLNFSDNSKAVQRTVCFNRNISEQTIYGIKGINVMIRYLKSIKRKDFIDYRQMYFLYNHKVNMQYKIHFLIEKGYLKTSSIAEKYDTVVKASKICLSLTLKYSITKKEELIEKIIFYLETVYRKEIEIFTELVDFLEMQC